MTVRAIETGSGSYTVQGEGYTPHGRIENARGEPARGDDLREILTALVLCQNASVRQRGRRTLVEGDPLEAALIVAGHKFGLREEDLFRREPRLHEVPFSSELQRMTTIVGRGAQIRQITKGAPEMILQLSSHELAGGRVIPLTAERRRDWLGRTAALGSQSLRALAVAEAPAKGLRETAGLTFLGVVGLLDPPRAEVARSIQQCHSAGIRTIMVTGDHPDTAAAIARQLGILRPGDHMASGSELEDMRDEDLRALARSTTVYARVSPEFKLRLVEALRQSGEVVAMTGDGLNDAPALNAADIGVAMGISGCDVTKEAADMVLSDDNFATIVAAVEEGRGIYDNIRRVVRYLLTCNVGEVLVMLLAALAGLPLPLLPIQILWVNLATDGLPALALGLEPVHPEVLSRQPRPRSEGIFAQRLGWKISARGTLIGLGTLGIFLAARLIGLGLGEARTLAFATLVMSQLFHAFDCRSETRSLLEIGVMTNPYLIGAFLSSIGLLLLAIYLPVGSATFETVRLGIWDWAGVLAVSGAGSLSIIVRRRLLRRRVRTARA